MAGPTTQNQYSPQIVPLDGGLDFITPKLTVAQGTLSACLNMERTDRMGYSRIFGYERFDGGMFPSLAYTNLVYITHLSGTFTAPPRTELFLRHNDGSNGPVLGALVDHTPTKSLIAITNYDEWRFALMRLEIGGAIVIRTDTPESLTVTATQDFDTGYAASVAPTVPNAQGYTLARNEYFETMNDLVTYPGEATKPVIGLHGYKDQIYAVKDLRTLYFEDGNEQVYSNDSLRIHGSVASDDIFTVLDVHLLTGTWAGGDATGVLLVSNTEVGDGVYDLIRPVTSPDNVLEIMEAPDDVDMTAWDAGMWRSNNYEQAQENSVPIGWEFVDVGYYMGFVDGTQFGPPRIFRRGVFSVYTTDTFWTSDVASTATTTDSLDGAMTPIPGDSWSYTGATLLDSVIHDNQTSKYVRRVLNNSVSTVDTTPGNLNLDHFASLDSFNSTSGLNVQGMEVVVRTRAQPLTAQFCPMSMTVQPRHGGALAAGTLSESQDIQQNYTPGGFPAARVQYLTFGSPTDLWGLDETSFKAILDNTFGVALQPWAALTNDIRQGIIDTFYVEVKVYFTQDITNYYFWNGVDDVTAAVTNVFVSDGDWSTNDAEGTLQVTDIQPYLTADRRFITDGDEIRTAPGGAGLLVGTVDTEMAFNGLDTLAEIEEAKSRYEFITANFYGQEDFEAMYGVSGAGRAFSYDGFYFDRIFAIPDEELDHPRHITDHQFHLVLGYKAGVIELSVTGNPQDFDPVFGATEIAVGDPVTGFSRMPGTTLGIFCQKTVQGLVGTSIDNFSLSVLNAYEGATEYTVKNAGSKVIYTSYRGITMFDPTAAYGDFAGTRLSYAVTPFLAPRLQGLVAPLGAVGASSGPVCAYVCRTKNQYILVFGDGYCLVMTLASDQNPIFTLRAYAQYDEEGIFIGYGVPRAESSFIDDKGAERIHMSFYSQFTPVDTYYVHELERSWTFDGIGIPSYLVSNENFFGSLFDYDTVRYIRLHGLSLGYAPIYVRVGKNYDVNDSTLQDPLQAIDCSLPRTTASLLSSDYNSVTSKTHPAKRGVSFSMRVMSYDIQDQPSSIADPVYADVCPPFVLQAMLVQNTENKGDT